jgi:hypothetical protein
MISITKDSPRQGSHNARQAPQRRVLKLLNTFHTDANGTRADAGEMAENLWAFQTTYEKEGNLSSIYGVETTAGES